jgi:hypothetical protein
MLLPNQSRRAAAALLLAALLAACGCGRGGQRGSAATGPTPQDAAEDVARLLKEFAEEQKRAPAGLGEVAHLDAAHPVGYPALARGEYLLYWKVPLSTGPEAARTVLAYHKDVPAQGGPVVMLDGTVKQMSADEFRSAPRAGR